MKIFKIFTLDSVDLSFCNCRGDYILGDTPSSGYSSLEEAEKQVEKLIKEERNKLTCFVILPIYIKD